MAIVIIQLEGGLVQNAFLMKNELSPKAQVEGVLVVDFDTEGADGDELTVTTDQTGAYLEALTHEESFFKLKPDSDVARIARAFYEPTLVAKTPEKDLPLLLDTLISENGKKALEDRLKRSA